MSGTATALADADKVDTRRFCGYPAFGAEPGGFTGWRFFQAYGLLEFRMNNLSSSEVAVVQGYLTTLRSLESGVPNSAANLDTESAAVWTHNPNEVRDRTSLFDDWRGRLCAFLGVPPGPGLSTGTIRVVV
jgi:hypothetical protein